MKTMVLYSKMKNENFSYDTLYDTKWFEFIRRSRLFRYIPFIDFVLAAGSMAYGEVKESSDFDCLVGVKFGRIFTARFFSALIFGLFGYRRKKLDHKEEAKNKICLNHFVTEKSYKLSPPYNDYWKNLYLNLVPIFGDKEKIDKFFETNKDWTSDIPKYAEDLRYGYKKGSFFKTVLEFILIGFIGNTLEKILKKYQVSRIEGGLHREEKYKPRIIYSDSELEFHPDTRRIENFGKII